MRLLMTVTITASAPESAARYSNPAFECGGAFIRAHCRPLATVVSFVGEIDGFNVDRVIEYTRRFILGTNALVLDLSGLDAAGPQVLWLLHCLDEECQNAGVEWALVPGRPMADLLGDSGEDGIAPMMGSVHEALHHFADVILKRRELLLPLIKKTA
jgi:anti-anti-sigma regulatory factor